MRTSALRSCLCLALLFGALAPAPARAFDWLGKIELDAEGLKASDPQKRLQAVQRLGQYDTVWTKEYLVPALRDRDRKVRAAAGRILARARVPEAVPIVISWLSSTEIEDKKVAAEILGELGAPKAVPALIRSLGDLDHEVRLQAVVALGRIGDQAVVVPLIGRLEDEKPEVRRAAVEQLMALGDSRAVIPLVGVFSDSSLDVRVAAVTAVGRLGDMAAVPALIRLLDDPVDQIKVAAVTALGNLRSAEAAPTLIDLMQSGSTEFRAKVAFSLGQIANSHGDAPVARTAVRALVRALANGRLRAAAREALFAAGASAVPALVAHLEGRLQGDPTTAVTILRDLGDPRATPALVDELERGRLSRELVLEALSKSGDRRALVPVLGLLSNEDPAVRLHAMRALGRMIEPGGKAADILVKALRDPSNEVRVLAADYLGRLRAVSAIPQLMTLAREGAIEVRVAAVQALGDIGNPEASPLLLELLRDGPSDLHLPAANALTYISDRSTVGPLMTMAQDVSAPSRPLIIRCIGGVLRNRKHDQARELLERTAREDGLRVSLAAIGALGAMSDARSLETLERVARGPSTDRKRAALIAIGDLGSGRATPLLLESLRSSDDRVAAAAALALGKRGDAGAVQQLYRATRRQGFATPVNASYALATLARQKNARQVLPLLHHRSRLVRTNAAIAAGRLQLARAKRPLTQLLRDDRSWLVRQAAARALSRLPKTKRILSTALASESNKEVKATLTALAEAPFSPPKRSDWRTFYFVDPTSGDAPVRQEPYFLVASDGLVTALYTDANGEYTEERFPEGQYQLEPAQREREY